MTDQEERVAHPLPGGGGKMAVRGGDRDSAVELLREPGGDLGEGCFWFWVTSPLRRGLSITRPGW